jgi:hypothetical protein
MRTRADWPVPEVLTPCTDGSTTLWAGPTHDLCWRLPRVGVPFVAGSSGIGPVGKASADRRRPEAMHCLALLPAWPSVSPRLHVPMVFMRVPRGRWGSALPWDDRTVNEERPRGRDWKGLGKIPAAPGHPVTHRGGECAGRPWLGMPEDRGSRAEGSEITIPWSNSEWEGTMVTQNLYLTVGRTFLRKWRRMVTDECGTNAPK